MKGGFSNPPPAMCGKMNGIAEKSLKPPSLLKQCEHLKTAKEVVFLSETQKSGDSGCQ